MGEALSSSPVAAVAAAVAVFGSLVAIGSTVERWLWDARRRRQHETLTAAFDAEENPALKAAIDRARRRVTAQQLAAFWVPAWRLGWSIWWAPVMPLFAGLSTYLYGWGWLSAVYYAFTFGALSMSFGGTLGAYIKRANIARTYVERADSPTAGEPEPEPVPFPFLKFWSLRGDELFCVVVVASLVTAAAAGVGLAFHGGYPADVVVFPLFLLGLAWFLCREHLRTRLNPPMDPFGPPVRPARHRAYSPTGQVSLRGRRASREGWGTHLRGTRTSRRLRRLVR